MKKQSVFRSHLVPLQRLRELFLRTHTCVRLLIYYVNTRTERITVTILTYFGPCCDVAGSRTTPLLWLMLHKDDSALLLLVLLLVAAPAYVA